MGGGFGLGGVAYLLGLASVVLIMLGTFELKGRFNFPLFQYGGLLLLVGSLASLVATFASIGAIQAAVQSRDPAALSAALTWIFLAGFITIGGWVLIGGSLIVQRRAVAEAAGAGKQNFVLFTGIFLILFVIPLVGVLLLGLLFLRLAKVAPAAPAAPPAA